MLKVFSSDSKWTGENEVECVRKLLNIGDQAKWLMEIPCSVVSEQMSYCSEGNLEFQWQWMNKRVTESNQSFFSSSRVVRLCNYWEI